MSVAIRDLIVQTEAATKVLGHAPSTRWQYQWAWTQFEEFCSQAGVDEFSEDAVESFLVFVAEEHQQGRMRDWKRRLFRKAVLVLAEVARTGSYQWKLSRPIHPNDALDARFRPVQEQFEQWLDGQGLAVATRNLYATVSRTALAWLPTNGATNPGKLSGQDVAAIVVFLGERYRPESMRTVLTAVRVLCRFLEESAGCTGLSRAVPRAYSRRSGTVHVVSAQHLVEWVNSTDMNTPVGRRDKALLLLAVRTGMRPVDMVGLRLADIDWRQGRITFTQHKTGTMLTLPLLADVGEAISDYLLNDRPADAGDDHVFLRSQAPFTALAPSNSLYHVAATAFARTETGPPERTSRGFRVVRASFATGMLQRGTPLPVISGALGHRVLDSSKHYLAGDEDRMRTCCLDFAGIEPRSQS